MPQGRTNSVFNARIKQIKYLTVDFNVAVGSAVVDVSAYGLTIGNCMVLCDDTITGSFQTKNAADATIYVELSPNLYAYLEQSGDDILLNVADSTLRSVFSDSGFVNARSTIYGSETVKIGVVIVEFYLCIKSNQRVIVSQPGLVTSYFDITVSSVVKENALVIVQGSVFNYGKRNSGESYAWRMSSIRGEMTSNTNLRISVCEPPSDATLLNSVSWGVTLRGGKLQYQIIEFC